MFRVIDHAVDASMLRAVWATWPDESWRGWHRYADQNAMKYGTRDAEQLPKAVKPCLEGMVRRVSSIIGVAFPDWDLHGAGLHMIPSDGFLGQHVDSEVMPGTGWIREFSCVLNVNPTWRDEWGGILRIGTERVIPKFNRLAVFSTADVVHEVTRVSGQVPRCTLSVFFWSLPSSTKTAGRRTQARFVGSALQPTGVAKMLPKDPDSVR